MTFVDSRLFAVDSRLFAVDSRLFVVDSRLLLSTLDFLLSTLDFYSRLSTFTLDLYSRPSTFDILVYILAFGKHQKSILKVKFPLWHDLHVHRARHARASKTRYFEKFKINISTRRIRTKLST